MPFEVKCFFHKDTSTCQFVVTDVATKATALIDTVLDYDPVQVTFSSTAIDEILDYCSKNNFEVKYVLDTHAHADHISAAAYVQKKTSAVYGIGEYIEQVQKKFVEVFNIGSEELSTSVFGRLFKDGETFQLGETPFRVMHTPGHTPACVSYVVGEKAVFVGDTIFMPDFGSARCDFPAGSAQHLYQSIKKLFTLPDDAEVFVGHDYAPAGREYAWKTTILEEKKSNVHINENTTEEDFVAWRNNRDKQLGNPKLLYPSLQINIRGGNMPPPESNGMQYIRLPIKSLVPL